MTARPTLLFYCQHSVGLGHLMRSYALSAQLSERFRVVLLCGGTLPDGIAPPPGVEIVALPALGVANGRFGAEQPQLTVERAWAVRTELIQATFARLRPSVVLVELFPFGRAKFARELVPLLQAARRAGAVTACSLRDILVSRRADQARHEERACRLANAWLDAVLVHSDPGFARLEDTFAARTQLAVPVHYTGFVVAEAPQSSPMRERHVVVSAGGGRVGAPLLRAALAAQPLVGAPMRLIAGPLAPEEDWEARRAAAAGQPAIQLVRAVGDLRAELARAGASVSQCGYNTALEVVRSRVPALVVPYATEEEDEQTRRARRLERLGALRVLPGEALSPERLAAELRELAAYRPAAAGLDLDGAAATTELLCGLLASERAA
jgi:predicted glycosyltransferase